MATVEVRASKLMASTAAQVFDAWLNPAMIAKFMFGPHLRDEQIVRLELDPRVGGSFSFVVNRGGSEINHIGEYLRIDRARDLRFTWAVAGAGSGSIVRITLAPAGAGCEATIVLELPAEWADFVERSRQAWTKMLDALDRALD